nr:probable methyltransferase PMT26 [Ipomoea batatas]GME12722.1 probable methyltransferase PMT26 [Ipomoea batatas]
MAMGKYTRVDGRKPSSNYCSTVTIVIFVALCLVGVWMSTSSSVVPIQKLHMPSQEIQSDSKTQVSSKNEYNSGSNENKTSHENSSSEVGKSKQFEDIQTDLPEEASKGDVVTQKENNPSIQETQKHTEQTQEGKIEEKSVVDKNNEWAEKNEEESNENGELMARDKESEAGEKNESKSGGEGLDVNNSNVREKEETSAEEKDGDYKNGKIGERGEDKMDLEGEMSENEPGQGENKEVSNVNKPYPGDAEIEPEETTGEAKGGNKIDKVRDKKDLEGSSEKRASYENFPFVSLSELLNETTTQNGAFSTQATESTNVKEAQKSSESDKESGHSWKLCNVTAGPDYIPCLDNLEAIRNLKSTKHYEHRERHCPDDPPTCLVPLPQGYQTPIKWPTSRDKIWYHNVPHTKLARFKARQNWVKVSGEYLTFPGGGTQFKHGALHYIDFIQQTLPEIAWGTRTRVVLDVGCGVASFGGYLFERDVLTMSLAPNDEHEAQVQLALERGIPAISAVMGTKRLPFPGRVFDIVHCARCRVPWHIEGGTLLLELNRLLRPGGYFVWSATPVYQKRRREDVEIWEAMKKLTKSMCWELLTTKKDRRNRAGFAIFQKPTSNECYEQRSRYDPPLCQESDDPDAAWNVPLRACMHKVPTASLERGSRWPEMWPDRLKKPPYWLLNSQTGVYGKPAAADFIVDYQHWKRVVTKSYLNGIGINWSAVRNAMDMRAIYGGFAAALRELNVWVMNIVSIDAPDTLPIIYERGLFGIYHDWCESFSTYPRSYDLLHADHLFSNIKAKCSLPALVAEVDRILRPDGKLIVRDNVKTISELENMFQSMHYEIRVTYSKNNEGLLCVVKTMWRPKEAETLTYAIA